MSLKLKLLIIVTMILFIQFSVLFIKDKNTMNKNMLNHISNVINYKYSSFYNSIKEYEKIGDMYLNGLLANKEIISAFKNKDRDKLIKLTKDSYDFLKKEGKIEQLQFHEIPAKSFLRLHILNKYGDDLSGFRHTVVEANKQKKQISGIEIGVGDVGVRIVRAVFDENGEHIGSVEYGGNLNNKFIEEFIKKADENLKSSGFNISIVSKNLKNEYMLVGSNYEKELEKNVENIINELKNNKQIIKLEKTKVINYNQLRDFSDNLIGYIKIEFNIESIKKEQLSFYIKTITIYILSLIISIMAITFVLNKFFINKIEDVYLKSIELSKGNIGILFDESGKDEIKHMSEGLNKFLLNLKNIINDIKDYSIRVASGTEEMSATMQEISNSIIELGNNSNNTAAAIEELTSTTNTIYRNVEELSKNAESTLNLAKNGGEAVKETIKEIHKIKEVVELGRNNVRNLGSKTNEIGEIITVINEIASQTNLLALNAAIEAARAGEAGKGFEVVAEEVRKLSEKTTDATKEIGKMIKEIQNGAGEVITRMEEVNSEVEKGVKTANNTGTSLEEIVSQTVSLRDMVQTIVNSIKEQSVASEEIAKQTDKITRNLEDNSKSVEQSTEAIREIADIADRLSNIVNQFKLN